MDPKDIADFVIENATTKEQLTYKDLWQEQACVIVFLRRFG